jgi:ankyrin repeat protein
LHYAAKCGSLDVCRAILKKGGNPNVIDKAKMTPAHEAAAGGHFPVRFFTHFFLLQILYVLIFQK